MKNFILKILIFFSVIISFNISAYGKSNTHLFLEKDYQQAWCRMHNGITEYRLPDKSRVDCLTNTHVIEFDFVKKVYESIGQALYYSAITGKKPGIVLISESGDKDKSKIDKLRKVSLKYHIDFWVMTIDDLLNN